MPLPVQTFATFAELGTYIDENIRPNGMELITGSEHNAVENGLLTFIEQSPLNWQTARIESGGGVLSAIRPLTVFMTTTPSSFTWSDNIYNEYRFINTTSGDIPTVATYYDINLQAVNVIPAKSIVNISKASNGLWIVSSVPSAGSKAALPPYIGIVDGGDPTDPVSGTSVFQDPSIVGLGSTNGGKISIQYAEGVRNNFGQNSSFVYDPVLGKITLDNAEEFFPLSSLWIDRNQ